MNPGRRVADIVLYALLGAFAAAAFFPVVFMLCHSFMSSHEISAAYQGTAPMGFHLIPARATLQGYIRVLFMTPDYLVKFWNSIFLAATTVAGQVVLSCISAYGFARFKFPGRNFFMFLLVVLMMMPVQVTLVPSYMVLDTLGLINTYAALILPGICAAFGVFLITQVFATIPQEILEAARLDGAGRWRTLVHIVIPHSKAGIASLVILSFIDNWNLVEQPLAYLNDRAMHPLSVFLSYINSDLSIAFVCGIIAMAPAVLLFLHLRHALMSGIETTRLPIR